MICIVGLGNPGEKYQNNRHNVGFQFIDYLIENLQNPNSKIQKNLSSIIYHLSSNLILSKPLTFMNRSGLAVRSLTTHYKLLTTNLIVVHDDLDIPLGKFKIQKGTGPELHNGIESIEQHLKTKDFWRVRIGVDNRANSPERTKRVEGETYVLNDFSQEEAFQIRQVFSAIFSRLKREYKD